MPLTKLQFKPGINRETTSYSNEGGWFDGDKVRFRFGFPEKIGGWERTSNNQYLGTARSMHPFTDLEETKLLGVGTTKKFYVVEGLGFNDITPIRALFTSSSTVSGVTGTGAVGAVEVLINPVYLAGLEATGSAGAVEVFINDIKDLSVFVTGTEATASVGSVTVSINTAPAVGLQATGEVGVATASVPTVDVDGIAGTASVGSVVVTTS